MTRHYSAWHRDVYDPRDHVFTLSSPSIKPYVERLGLGVSRIEDQGPLGSCTGNSSTSGIEIVLDDGNQYSRLMAYYNGRKIEGTVRQDAGAQIRDVIKGLMKTGTATEATWPYDISKFKKKPVAKAFGEAHDMALAVARAGIVYESVPDLDSMLQALNAGSPVVFGFTVFESFESEEVANTGLVPMPKYGEKQLGGHAVLAVGYDVHAKYVWVQNSWGKDWGVDGYFKMPFAYFTPKLTGDLWAIRRKGAAA